MLTDFINKIQRPHKKIILVILDIFITIATIHLAFYLRTDSFFFLSQNQWTVTIFFSFLLFIIFFMKGFYNSINKIYNLKQLMQISKYTLIYSLILVFIITFLNLDFFPRSVVIIHSILFLLFSILIRIIYIFISNEINKISTVLVFISENDNLNSLTDIFHIKYAYNIRGFVNINNKSKFPNINNIKIFKIEDLNFLIKKIKPNLLVCVSNNLNDDQKLNLFLKLNNFNIRIQFIKVGNEISKNNIDIKDIVKKNISLDFKLLENDYKKKNILVTGAGGSIGQELCCQILKFNCENLIILDHSEISLYRTLYILKKILDKSSKGTKIIPILGSILDNQLLKTIFSKYKPNKIFHAAAYKHVSLVEQNYLQSINNNVFGTINLINLAVSHNCQKFILISSDKAVNPTNIMGLTKRLSEIALESYSDKFKKVIFCSVRFGNVLDSSGSVIPLFRNQIKEKSSITVTHPKVERYFMLISEAVSLVLSADQMAKGGEVFTLNMGKQQKILKIAKLMIRAAGFIEKNKNNPDGDISIKFIGLSKGEKLKEELNYNSEKLFRTVNKNIFKTYTRKIKYPEFIKLKKILQNLIDKNTSYKEFKHFFQKNIKKYN
jgi:FlaA1/EpsC-like NDP-sugar epimerase